MNASTHQSAEHFSNVSELYFNGELGYAKNFVYMGTAFFHE